MDSAGGWGGGGSIFKLISEVFLENYGSRRGVGGGVQEMGGGCGHHHRHTKEKKKVRPPNSNRPSS